jgi:phage gpG-like protein
MAETVTVKGARELRATTLRAASELSRMDTADKRAGAYLAQRAKGMAPRVTGRLAGSIRAGRTQDAATVTATAVYAGVIHWGWPARNIRAHPFLTDALSAGEPTVATIYMDQVTRIVYTVKGA